jgi:UDP-N-acetylglucosamine--N-acetylmuramyl-(pentapeptide) pyrophosphoryl-undecaprenol N-acetylglucosamine transferase
MSMKIGVACGGTGGHIFPGLATADVLRRRGHEVTLWLGGRGVESLSVEGWAGPVARIRASGFPSGLSWSSFLVAFGLLRAVARSRGMLKRDPPDVLLAMGSYSSVGPVLAARTLGVPIVLHEANAVPGRAIAFLARSADAVAITFQTAAQTLRHRHVLRTGLPIRPALLGETAEPLVTRAGLFTVLVMGGSQGARQINRIASEALCRLHARGVPVQAVHLSGAADEASVRATYEQHGVSHVVFPFLKEMNRAYRAADLAISRAGASSCMELAFFAVPSLLIPFPSARRDHQTANARELEQVGGADVRAEADLTVEWLCEYIERGRQDAGRRAAMSAALRGLALPDAAERLADLVEETGRDRVGEKRTRNDER